MNTCWIPVQRILFCSVYFLKECLKVPFHLSSSIYCPWSMLQMVTWVLTIPHQQVHLLILPQISAERRIAFWYACSLSFFFLSPLVKCLCALVWRTEWAQAKSKFTHLTLTMLMFGSKARTWPLYTNSHPSKLEERSGRVSDQLEPDNSISTGSICFRWRVKRKT